MLIDQIVTAAALIGLALVLYYQHQQRNAQRPVPKSDRRERDPNDTRDWPAIVAKATELAVLEAKPAVALQISDSANDDAPHSCLGGRPSLPSDMTWPVDQDGKPMIFLAQINYAEMPPLAGYPTSGLISFFVRDSYDYGAFDTARKPDSFRALYFPEVADLKRAPLPDPKPDMSPMNDTLHIQGRALTGVVTTGMPQPLSYQIDQLTTGWYPNCPDALYDGFLARMTGGKPGVLYYGGHPAFTQDDFRHLGPPARQTEFSEVILQMGYLHDPDAGVHMSWGDAGEAMFLITMDDLTAQRFDRSIFYWDCH